MGIENEKLDGDRRKSDDITHYVDLFIHWDESYWQAAYVFLVVQGTLIAALTQIKSLTTDNSWLLLVFFFSIFGVIISIFNILVLNRKMSYTHGSEDMLREKYKILYERIKERQTGFKKVSSAKIMHTYFPSLFYVFWIIVMFSSLCLYIRYS